MVQSQWIGTIKHDWYLSADPNWNDLARKTWKQLSPSQHNCALTVVLCSLNIQVSACLIQQLSSHPTKQLALALLVSTMGKAMLRTSDIVALEH